MLKPKFKNDRVHCLDKDWWWRPLLVGRHWHGAVGILKRRKMSNFLIIHSNVYGSQTHVLSSILRCEVSRFACVLKGLYCSSTSFHWRSNIISSWVEISYSCMLDETSHTTCRITEFTPSAAYSDHYAFVNIQSHRISACIVLLS